MQQIIGIIIILLLEYNTLLAPTQVRRHKSYNSHCINNKCWASITVLVKIISEHAIIVKLSNNFFLRVSTQLLHKVTRGHCSNYSFSSKYFLAVCYTECDPDIFSFF